MATRQRTRQRGRAARRREPRGRRTAWTKYGLWAAGLAAVVVLGYFAVQLANPTSEVNSETELVAEGNAGGPVDALRGTHQTVYHSQEPLPGGGLPQAQGKPTLVWFSATWCEFCEQMEPFAHEVISRYRERAVFVEKSVDHDRDAALRYGIRGTPTFVLIDPSGQEIVRFGFQPTAQRFAQVIEQALTAAGA